MGVFAGFAPRIVRLDRSIRLRVLQLDAHICDNRSGYDGSLQTEKLVRVLPHGNDDAGNLSNSEYEQTGLAMNTLYDAIAPVLCPANALLDAISLALRLLFGICLFVIILEVLSYPFNRSREFSLENYQYRFVRNLVYALIVIVVLSTLQGWLHKLLGKMGDNITNVICGAYPVVVLGLAIYDYIEKRKNRM